MSFPQVKVEVSMSAPPTGTPVYVDLSARVLSLSIRRGRRLELDRFTAGTATVVLSDVTRDLDPTFAAGLYYGDVLPTRMIRISAIYNAVTYRLFTGFIEDWQMEFRASETRVQLIAVDAFMVLSSYDLRGVYAAQLSSRRVELALDEIGWFVTWRAIGVGHTQVAAADFSDAPVKALSHLQAVERTERGQFHVAPDGDIVFRERHWRQATKTAVSATFGNSGSFLRVTDLRHAYDRKLIYNSVSMQAAGSDNVFTEVDGGSQDDHYPRSWGESGLLTSDNEAESAAEWFIAEYADAVPRFTSLTYEPSSDAGAATYLPIALGLDISDRIAVNWRPMNATPAITQDCWIEGVSQDYAAGSTWRTSYSLSPAKTIPPPVGGGLWVLNVSVLSVDTYLAY